MKILIPAKGVSVRCPGKNIDLLPFISKYLTDQQKNDAVVISDDKELLLYAGALGLNGFYSPETNCELLAMADYMKQYSDEPSFIYLPLTQPLRELGLIDKITQVPLRDVIVSINKSVDRSIFEVKDNKFVINSECRKGCMCKAMDFVDGAIYRISTDFLLSLTHSQNTNKDFWSSRVDFIENNVPFLDIDTVEDMDKFINLQRLFYIYK